MKFHRDLLIISRDIDFLVETKVEFFKPEVDTKTYKK